MVIDKSIVFFDYTLQHHISVLAGKNTEIPEVS